MLALIRQDKSGSITGWMFGDDTFELAARAQAAGAPDLAHRLREEPYPISGKVEIMPGCTLLRDGPPKHVMGCGVSFPYGAPEPGQRNADDMGMPPR